MTVKDLQIEQEKKIAVYTKFYENPQLLRTIRENTSVEGSLRPSEKVRDARLALEALDKLKELKHI